MVSKVTTSKRRKRKECIINCLPGDLIEKIFLKLPVSTLLRCIGVCKQWCNFIREPQFVTSHMRHAPRCALCFFPQQSVSGKPYPAEAILIDEAWSPSTSVVPVIGPDDFLFGSCNGLLGLYTNTSTIKIANLATGQCLHLEKPIKKLRGDHFSFYSFGFHPVTKEYKIIHFLGKYIKGRHQSKDICNVIQVYTLGDEKWKDVRTPIALSLNSVKKSRVVIVDGTMYWLTDNMATDGQQAVMSFDLSDESFSWIQLPAAVLEGCEHNGPHQFWIREIDGKLCIATAKIHPYVPEVSVGKMQIWTLDNKGEERWSQKYSILYSPRRIPGPHFVHWDKFLTQYHDGRLCSNELFSENSDIILSNMLKLLDFSPRKADNIQSYIFVKSLVHLDVYRKAGIVRRPKQRNGWDSKKWQVWERRPCMIEDNWSRLRTMEHKLSVLAHISGKNNQVLQHLRDDVIGQQIFMELIQMPKHRPDGPNQPRFLRRPNMVGLMREADKLLARLDKLDDIVTAMLESV